jgi:hypothetical protein
MIWRSEVLVREHVVVGTCADSLDHNALGFVHDVSVISVETLHFLCVRAATDQVVASSAVAACPLSRMVLLFGDYINRTLDPHALTHVAEDCGAVDSDFIGQSDEEALFVVPVVRSSDDFDHLIVCGFVRIEPTRRTVHDLHAINGDVLPYTRSSIIRRLGSADETCLMASQRLTITLAIGDEIGGRCGMDLFLCSLGHSELMYRMARMGVRLLKYRLTSNGMKPL